MRQNWIAVAGLFGFAAVALGAFGAHMLRERVENGTMTVREFDAFQTGATYQMYHSLALLGVQVVANKRASKAATLAGSAFLLGMLVFSGSLYAFALTGQRWFGAITPIGGTAFLFGWAFLAIAAFSRNSRVV